MQRVTPYIYRLKTFLSSLIPYTFISRRYSLVLPSFPLLLLFRTPSMLGGFPSHTPPAFGALAYIVQGSGGERGGSLAWRLLFLENKKQKRHTGGINPSNVPINQILIYFEWKYITFLKGCLPYIFSNSKKLI